MKLIFFFFFGFKMKGNISRQEAVSMVPAFFLEVKGKDNVLDMCAAPGSKTSQILEFMTHDSKSPGIH
jgi:16S rRNA C967 or C1407 C5-methylase (RsmB/RsmF family)